MTAETTEWAGPARYLPPPAPVRRDDGALHYVGATYAAPGGYRPLQLDLYVPDVDEPAPLVVWIHGGGWMMGDRRYLPETLRPNQVFDELDEIDQAESSFVYLYLHRLVNQAAGGAPEPSRPSTSSLARQASAASLSSQPSGDDAPSRSSNGSPPSCSTRAARSSASEPCLRRRRTQADFSGCSLVMGGG